MDSKLYQLITDSSHYRPGDMENLFCQFKSQSGKSSYQEIINDLPIQNGMHILELPAGTAPISKLLLDQLAGDLQLSAVDFNQKELDRIGDKRINKMCESAQKLSLSQSSVDYVFCHLGIMLFNPLEAALKEIYRVLKPGGFLVANIINFEGSEVLKVFSQTSGKYLKHVEGFPGWGDARGNDHRALEPVMKEVGFSTPVKHSSYSVAFKGDSKKVISTAGVFFQVNLLLNEELRTQYLTELRENLDVHKCSDGLIELEIPFERMIALK